MVKEESCCASMNRIHEENEISTTPININYKAIVCGLLAGIGILAFYLIVLTIFESRGFALYELKRLWPWLVPLAVGFGTQIGLYISIRHDAVLNGGIGASGTVSGGSMLICCSHYLLTMLPIIGVSGLTVFLMSYQKAFFAIGIASSVIGIILMLRHKKMMREIN